MPETPAGAVLTVAGIDAGYFADVPILRGLDMTVAYSKERVQFGVPIAMHQAVRTALASPPS